MRGGQSWASTWAAIHVAGSPPIAGEHIKISLYV
jgi:hypothetical protein